MNDENANFGQLPTKPQGAASDPNDQVAQLQAKLREAQEAAARAQAEREAEAAVQVEVETEPDGPEPATTGALSTANPGNFLAAIPGAAGATMDALIAATESDDSGGASNIFPVLTQVPGTSGGAFQRAKFISDEDAANLPEGRKPFIGVFMGFRFLATSWPRGFEEGNDAPKPVFSCAVPASEPKAIGNLMATGKNYQFTKRDHKDKWDWDASQVGHIRPVVEILLFDPTSEELFIFQTCAHYNSAKDTRDQLIANATTVEGGGKAMLPFVGRFTPKTTKVSGKNGYDIVHHWIEIGKLDITDSHAQQAWQAYQRFAQSAQQDQGVMDKVNRWFAGDDAPLHAQAKTALEGGSAMD